MTSSASSPSTPWRGSTLWTPLLLALLGVGFVSRVAPLFDVGGRVIRQFPTEDGYLSLTIARNMALGHGMSVSNGTVPTNGTQPFFTWVWSLAFRLTNADKVSGVFVVQLFELAMACIAAGLLYRVGQRLLKSSPWGRDAAALAACAWFAAPVGVPHTMNCLESGGYVLVVLVAITILTSIDVTPGDWSWGACLGYGLALGWAFWARNDAVFLIAAACLTHWLFGVTKGGKSIFGRSLIEAVVIGATTVVMAIPWLYYNKTTFDHLMPISGIAESHHASFAQNAHLMPASLLEYIVVGLQIPETLEIKPAIITAALVIDVFAIWVAIRWMRNEERWWQPAFWVVLGYGGGLLCYYGLYFGAPHFVSRYLFPLSPFAALLWAMLFLKLWAWLAGRGLGLLASLGLVGLVLVCTGLNARIYQRGANHMHFQVIEWIDENVPEDTWVGAIQTGTLGYWHDRTYNLDGKVDPFALEAQLQGEIDEYIIKRNIRYLADWPGIVTWASKPQIAANFEIIVDDKARRLAVLARTTP